MKTIEELELELQEIREIKDDLIKEAAPGCYERAAKARDIEKSLIKQITLLCFGKNHNSRCLK